MRRGIAALIGIAGLLLAGEAAAQTYTDHNCGTAPFAVGNAVVGGQVLARLGETTVKELPRLEARAGVEVVRSAYAGMRNQAMRSVLEWYSCRLEHGLKKDGGPDVEARVKAMKKAIYGVSLDVDLAQSAMENGFNIYSEYLHGLAARERAEGAFTLPAAKYASYLSDVDPSATWIKTSTISVWANAAGPAVQVGACGGVMRRAISDGGSSIQVSLSRVQSSLASYFDPTTDPGIGITSLLSGFAGNPVSTPSATEQASFRTCATALVAAGG